MGLTNLKIYTHVRVCMYMCAPESIPMIFKCIGHDHDRDVHHHSLTQKNRHSTSKTKRIMFSNASKVRAVKNRAHL